MDHPNAPKPNRPGRPDASTMVRTPMNDLTLEGAVAENNLLHRRVLMLTNLEIRLRAALELATGIPWDSEDIVNMNGEELQEHVAHHFARGMNLHIDDARERVRHHAAMADSSQIKGRPNRKNSA